MSATSTDGKDLGKAAMARFREIRRKGGTEAMLRDALTPKAKALIEACIAYDKRRHATHSDTSKEKE